MIIPACDLCGIHGKPPAWAWTWPRLRHWMRMIGWRFIGRFSVCPACFPNGTKPALETPAGQEVRARPSHWLSTPIGRLRLVVHTSPENRIPTYSVETEKTGSVSSDHRDFDHRDAMAYCFGSADKLAEEIREQGLIAYHLNMDAAEDQERRIRKAMRESAEKVRHIIAREKRSSRGGQVDPNFFMGNRP
jgi:hypothetical protein